MASWESTSFVPGLAPASFWISRVKWSGWDASWVAFSRHWDYKECSVFHLALHSCTERLFKTILYVLSFGGLLSGNLWPSLGSPGHSGAIKPLSECGRKRSKWTGGNFGQIWVRSVWGKTMHFRDWKMGCFSYLESEAECRGDEN